MHNNINILKSINRLGKWTLSLVFIGSGLIPLFLSDPIERLKLLQYFPFPETWHLPLFYTLVSLDILCGLLILIYTHRIIWLTLLFVSLGYTIMISLFAPDLWRDPFGTLLKNLPIVSWLIVMIWLNPAEPKLYSK